MATHVAIDMAARQPTRAVGVYNPDATLHRPRDPEEVEAEEHGKAARSVLRMVLSGHGCADLEPCPAHGRGVCACRPCTHEQHAADLADAVEALQAFGLKGGGTATCRRCSTCHLIKPIERFSRNGETCKNCLSKKRAEREARLS